ncbi:hypothetical protein REPUB_Repub03eG0159300 [Reevesia pubescens]
MAQGLDEIRAKLSLTESKQEAMVVDKTWVEESSEKCSLALIGKLFSRKFVNVDAMRNVFTNIWKLSHGLQVTVIGEKLYAFHFGDGRDDRAVMSQPWSFNKALLLLNEVTDMTILEAMNF